MKVGDTVRLTAVARAKRYLFPNPDVKGKVVRPGISRGGIRVRVHAADNKNPKTYSISYWEVDE
jgi:hypothetical protein